MTLWDFYRILLLPPGSFPPHIHAAWDLSYLALQTPQSPLKIEIWHICSMFPLKRENVLIVPPYPAPGRRNTRDRSTNVVSGIKWIDNSSKNTSVKGKRKHPSGAQRELEIIVKLRNSNYSLSNTPTSGSWLRFCYLRCSLTWKLFWWGLLGKTWKEARKEKSTRNIHCNNFIFSKVYPTKPCCSRAREKFYSISRRTAS